MPRYINQDTVTFTTKDGDKIPIKEIPEIKSYDTLFTINDLNAGIEIDEIAIRDDVFGEEAEYLAYTLWYHNIEKLVENKFDLSKLKEIKIPVVTNV